MSIIQEYYSQRQNLLRAADRPVRIVFSPHGHTKALHEQLTSQAFYPRTEKEPATYMGLPFTVDRDQERDIVVMGEHS